MKSKIKVFRAAPGARFGHRKAQRYGEAIDALKRKLGHAPGTDDIWRAAKAPHSPLHDVFTWNVRKAAEDHWRTQARNLVSHLEVVVVRAGKQEPVRAFFNVSLTKGGPTVYNDLESAARSPFQRNQIVAYALREAREWARKYKSYCRIGQIKVIYQAVMKAVG